MLSADLNGQIRLEWAYGNHCVFIYKNYTKLITAGNCADFNPFQCVSHYCVMCTGIADHRHNLVSCSYFNFRLLMEMYVIEAVV